MLAGCLSFVGYLCLVGSPFYSTSITIIPGIPYQSAELISGPIPNQWRARIYLSSDVIGITGLPYKAAAVSYACSDGTCVKYHRKCDNASAPKSCDFRIIGRPNPIHVEADSAEH